MTPLLLALLIPLVVVLYAVLCSAFGRWLEGVSKSYPPEAE